MVITPIGVRHSVFFLLREHKHLTVLQQIESLETSEIKKVYDEMFRFHIAANTVTQNMKVLQMLHVRHEANNRLYGDCKVSENIPFIKDSQFGALFSHHQSRFSSSNECSSSSSSIRSSNESSSSSICNSKLTSSSICNSDHSRPFRLFGSVGAYGDIVGGRRTAAKLIDALCDEFNKFLRTSDTRLRFDVERPIMYLCRDEETSGLLGDTDEVPIDTKLGDWKALGVLVCHPSKVDDKAWTRSIQQTLIKPLTKYLAQTSFMHILGYRQCVAYDNKQDIKRDYCIQVFYPDGPSISPFRINHDVLFENSIFAFELQLRRSI